MKENSNSLNSAISLLAVTVLCLKKFARNTLTLPAKESNLRYQQHQLPLNLDNLPYPDYSPYFMEMKQLFPDHPFVPLLPLEFSRGCWWNKCTFCNLNLQWQNYRFKESDRMVQETLHLAKTHESLHFTFTDNALPPKEADNFFQESLRRRNGS